MSSILSTTTSTITRPVQHMDTIPSAEFSAPTSGARNHRPSISSHTASSTSTMSREGSTGQSTPQEEVIGPNKRAVHPSTTNPVGDPFDQSQKENATGAQPKKKKGQRFFCTDFPPCNLSFTRSEHLARHIRKHTGERPFQCHCSRRFSRLDNLRQHAQTVHCNEPIPPDSLANTGSNRFARAARSERARKQTRVGAGRTHARTLSTSSVSSIVTPYGQQQGPEAHARRMAPPPLMLANDGHARARLSLDAAAEPMSPGAAARAAPYWYPAGASPTTSSYGGGTPGYPTTPDSGYFPPATGVQFWDHRRRVSSMPSVGSSYPPPTFTGSRPSYAQVFSSPDEHAYPPPPPPPAPATSYPDEDLRRRTWHPSPRDITNKSNSRPSTSDSDMYQQPELSPQYQFHRPDYNAPPAGELPRHHPQHPPHEKMLPGIESFDQPPHLPSQSPRQLQENGPNLSPKHPSLPDPLAERRASMYPSPYDGARAVPAVMGPRHAHHRRSTLSFDGSIRSEMGKLDLTDHSPIERSSPLKKSTKPTEPDTEMRAAPPAAANLKKEKGDVKAATPVPLHPPLAPSAAAAAAPFVSAALKTPLVSTTEISAKLDTNRLDVLVAVATGEARAN